MENISKVVIITGGAQGIGKGIARQMLTTGWAVVIADIDREAGEETLAEYQGLGAALYIATDVADEQSVQNCIDQTVARLGRIDGLVNNAGIAHPYNTPVEKLPLAEWQRIINTNLTGSFLMAKHAAPFLRQAKGAIVNIASTRALQSEQNTEAYSASKGGLVSLTHALAMSLGPAVRVNCISPGWIDVSGWKKSGQRKTTNLSVEDRAQHPVGRVGVPDDIASLTLFLLSGEAGFITGQNFVVDGGMTRKMIYVE